MDTRSTTIEVIAPTSKYLGEQMPVQMIYGEDVYVTRAGQTLRYHKSQVKVIHVRDFDDHLVIAGSIGHQQFVDIGRAIELLPGCRLCGGWTGQQGRIDVGCDLWSASVHLDAVTKIVAPYGLVVTKPDRALF